ncbi:hypothetical protein Vretimale_12269 [Volvox reticuliferus]|uniref:Uncharacterized protein n=1 Tax=Volvox reticuliferus TaxID=1737510 RepID=A0A8J4GJA0_9CHLO|nr:hypothetical protein Vretifemale_8982 [Volvox reticuliferus]GIM08304.1 hypothetical protein Vretimale_12269 [Volvox reticuliferus]
MTIRLILQRFGAENRANRLKELDIQIILQLFSATNTGQPPAPSVIIGGASRLPTSDTYTAARSLNKCVSINYMSRASRLGNRPQAVSGAPPALRAHLVAPLAYKSLDFGRSSVPIPYPLAGLFAARISRLKSTLSAPSTVVWSQNPSGCQHQALNSSLISAKHASFPSTFLSVERQLLTGSHIVASGAGDRGAVARASNGAATERLSDLASTSGRFTAPRVVNPGRVHARQHPKAAHSNHNNFAGSWVSYDSRACSNSTSGCSSSSSSWTDNVAALGRRDDGLNYFRAPGLLGGDRLCGPGSDGRRSFATRSWGAGGGGAAAEGSESGLPPPIIISPVACRVVVIGWMGSNRRYLNKYGSLWARSGDHEVLMVRPTVAQTLVRWRGVVVAGRDIDRVAKMHRENPAMPTIYHVFSTGGFIHAGTMWRWMDEVEDVAQRRDLLEEVRGIILDSAPAAVNAEMSARAIVSAVTNTPAEELSYGMPGWQGALLNGTRSFMESYLQSKGVKLRTEEVYDAWYNLAPVCPQLYLYSDADPLVPASDVERYMAVQEGRGVEVSGYKWPASGHVEHFRRYPQEYAYQISAFLARALRDW